MTAARASGRAAAVAAVVLAAVAGALLAVLPLPATGEAAERPVAVPLGAVRAQPTGGTDREPRLMDAARGDAPVLVSGPAAAPRPGSVISDLPGHDAVAALKERNQDLEETVTELEEELVATVADYEEALLLAAVEQFRADVAAMLDREFPELFTGDADVAAWKRDGLALELDNLAESLGTTDLGELRRVATDARIREVARIHDDYLSATADFPRIVRSPWMEDPLTGVRSRTSTITFCDGAPPLEGLDGSDPRVREVHRSWERARQDKRRRVAWTFAIAFEDYGEFGYFDDW